MDKVIVCGTPKLDPFYMERFIKSLPKNSIIISTNYNYTDDLFIFFANKHKKQVQINCEYNYITEDNCRIYNLCVNTRPNKIYILDDNYDDKKYTFTSYINKDIDIIAVKSCHSPKI